VTRFIFFWQQRPILAERHRTNGAEMATHGSSCRWTWTSHSLNRTLRHNRVPVVRNTVLSKYLLLVSGSGSMRSRWRRIADARLLQSRALCDALVMTGVVSLSAVIVGQQCPGVDSYKSGWDGAHTTVTSPYRSPARSALKSPSKQTYADWMCWAVLFTSWSVECLWWAGFNTGLHKARGRQWSACLARKVKEVRDKNTLRLYNRAACVTIEYV